MVCRHRVGGCVLQEMQVRVVVWSMYGRAGWAGLLGGFSLPFNAREGSGAGPSQGSEPLRVLLVLVGWDGKRWDGI